MIDWRNNPEGRPELNEFFSGKRKLFFVFVSDDDIKVRGERLTVDCHLVMKLRDGMVIPCWSTHDLAETAMTSIPAEPKRVVQLDEFAFSISVQNYEVGANSLTARRIHLVE